MNFPEEVGCTMSALDPARFEGVYAEEPPEYQVVRRDANREATDEVVLSVPTLDSYRDDADTIQLHDLATGAKRTIPYPA